ncbi:MAG: cofactor-independent phosphoglycerate mutase [Lachnospiraceae bacterium]
MKYIVILGDGMADEPIPALGDKTPMEYASTPAMDALAKLSEVGLTATIPEGMAPGSDTANLSVLGYNPRQYYTGRSPLEALSIGVEMGESDVALRCNLVTVTEDSDVYAEQTMVDHSSDEISTEDAAILLAAVVAEFKEEDFSFYTGTSYRHCLLWKNGRVLELAQPHDILEQKIESYITQEPYLRYMQEKSFEILKNHPLNAKRREQGLHPANSLWFWGAGTRPALDSFDSLYGKRGAMISAVDLLKGIAVGAEMDTILVEGANGGLHTNYEGKAQAAVKALTQDDYDFVYLHLEAPDEMGHQGSVEKKVQAIENLDSRIVANVKKELDAAGIAYRLLIMPDHPTPIKFRTHTSDPVPYLLYDSTKPQEHTWKYNEREAKAGGVRVPNGWDMMKHFFDA